MLLIAIAFGAAIIIARLLATAAPEGKLVSQAAGAAAIVIGPIVTLVLAYILGKSGAAGDVLTTTEILRSAALPAFGTLFVAPVAFWFFRRQHRGLQRTTAVR